MVIYGYARGALLADQVEQLKAAGCSVVYFDTSTWRADGAGWVELVDVVQRGDTVRFVSPDRLSRSVEAHQFITETLAALGVNIEYLS
ncbi:recombinase family protein [Nocardia caishijiensis]|uniref:Resolvase-like protein n=1 Tax=Nocardia caishijiensis TaxID=184756 RepID=A0ABQ6YE36_9NOCA|nr:recombinase family protein [Nocardia caishijiensis]KAF0835671.1 resolvase-like protein [Nocardia caishijiensis]